MINLCEKDLLGASATSTECILNNIEDDDEVLQASASKNSKLSYRGYTLDQVSYCIDMCEDTFKVQCDKCNEVMSR